MQRSIFEKGAEMVQAAAGDTELTPETEEVTPFQYAITSYGVDFDVAGLVKRVKSGDIYVPPFQRQFIWTVRDGSRFIETLLLGLPVPGIFLSREAATKKLLVIDGQQRLKTLLYFYEGVFEPTGKEFRLEDVQPRFKGKTYKTLADEERRTLDDAILHATVIKQDQPTDDESSIYYVFERLNTGGRLLQPQEIRACMYHGELNDLLSDLNGSQEWRALFGPEHKNRRDEELILRFFALYYSGNSYARPMKDFLNKFMGSNRRLQRLRKRELAELFQTTVDTILKYIGKRAFKPETTLNAAIFDAVMVGVARRLAKGPVEDPTSFKKAYDALLAHEGFDDLVTAYTADEPKVSKRIGLAEAEFGKVP